MNMIKYENDCIQNYCRTCASNRPDKRNLFEVIHDEKRLIEILEHCLKCPINTDDYFSNSICSDCSADLIKAYEFFALFERSEKWFISRYNAIHATQKIKSEAEWPLECENENILDISLKSEHATFVHRIEHVGIEDTQNTLNIKNELNSDDECDDDDELTGENDRRQFEFVPLVHDPSNGPPENHSKNVHKSEQTNPLQCGECSKTFSTPSNLKRHEMLHTAAKPSKSGERKLHRVPPHPNELRHAASYECFDCKLVFQKYMYLYRHMKTHSINRITFECTKCTKCFLNEHNFRKHKRKHTDLIFDCEYCMESFRLKIDLKSHVHIVHKGELKKFRCPECSATFPLRSLLKTHVARHSAANGNGECLCQDCGKVFPNNTALCAHLKIHSTIFPYHCTHCPSRFRFPALLKSHIQIHSEKKEFVCEIRVDGRECKKAFSSEKGLRTHKMIHMSARNHKCVCSKSFNTKFKLDRHILTHTGEKPHQCQHCEKAFAQKNDLTKHLHTHLGPKPHQCNECGESFRLTSELRKHSYKHFKADANA